MKKKMMKRILALTLAGTLAIGLTACGGTKSSSGETAATKEVKEEADSGKAADSKKNEDSTADSNDADQTDKAKSGEGQTIKLWHIFGGDTDPNKEIVDRVTSEAEEKFGVKIEVDTAENEAYKTKLKAAIAANETPDIFYTWGHGFLKPFVEAGKVEAMDEYLTDDFKSHLAPSTLSGFQFEGKTYGLTTDQSVACMFYNKEMFDKLNLEIPKTFDDLKKVCQTFLDNGITPLTVGGKEPWTIAMYHDLLALRAVGSEGVVSATGKETDFSDPGFLEAATCLRELVDMGAFPDGSAGISREESEVPFFQGQIPMYLNGSWTATRVYKDSSLVKDKVVAAPFPTLENGKAGVTDFTGGPDTAFAVSADTKDPALTTEVAQYIAYELAIGKYKIGSSILPYTNVDIDESEINPLLMDIYKFTKDASSYTIWWDNLMEGKDATVYLNKLQELFVGNITPEQYVEELQKLNK
ncbi:extracellular solute-binding protein [uncultured Robinsoniella sp.]|uniref:extracellular solute-binding protein n=1 Tax=uncultured Robinsoniella sp. TaxID=904190 RepID=UPI00374EAC66